ncbi:hypothetical protein BN1012_Phect1400 [Candidatus Phaeomarinobacter ectocarpi]|uniref:Uncharacterized protein n=1 Tax=Candidatus Phaeomarinibacter ectocarpi TaxID=1458461 RepID=X5MF48_9HYPH|nr:hypothetical protein BN1012_Phect1400 [Candidatus Phaeomarinobacter ectocarpi]
MQISNSHPQQNALSADFSGADLSCPLRLRAPPGGSYFTLEVTRNPGFTSCSGLPGHF